MLDSLRQRSRSANVSDGKGFHITGMGLAGCCLAWRLAERGVDFRWSDHRHDGAATPVAAGLINPVTGKNFQPSWRIDEFMPEALAFFRQVEDALDHRLWHPLPVVRWVTERDWAKVAGKLERPEVVPWVEGVEEKVGDWRAAVTLRGGGRFDTRAFRELTMERFQDRRTTDLGCPPEALIRCEGYVGLVAGRMGEHRCAKGEILTIAARDTDESRIQIGRGGWLVPLGGGLFKAGATYEWDELDGRPTAAGRTRVEEILAVLGVSDYEVVRHEAGVRPIVRRSQPLIGRLDDGSRIFNGLGSKGSLYAPRVSEMLADWLVEGAEIEPDFDVRGFLRKR